MTEPMEAKRCPKCGGVYGVGIDPCSCPDPPPAPVDEGEEGNVIALIDALGDRFCCYKGKPWPERICDCKFPPLTGPWSSEVTGCPELREIRSLVKSSLDQALRERDEARGRLRDLGARNPAEVIRDGHCVVCGEGASPGEPDDPNWHTMPCIIRRLLLAEAAEAQRDRYREAMMRARQQLGEQAGGKSDLHERIESAWHMLTQALSNPTPPASSEEDTP